ncbi:MAG TPA: MFS transporter [Candidatus Cybelea sp.]|jgi:MFS family permease|nr:MFS transporter [Candidatus Cybelea sp.]
MLRPAFVFAAVAFLIAMIGTTLPTPLYPVYEREFAIAPVLIPVIFAVYALAVVAGLLFFGRLSDEIGRRGVLLAGLILSGASAVVFLLAHSIAPLLIGRVLSGLSAGIFTGTATALLVELAPANRRKPAAMFAVGVNTAGLGLGTLLSGALATYAPAMALRLPYGVDAVLVVAGIAAVLAVPETVENRRAGFALRITRLSVPHEIRGTFWRAAIAGMCAFAVSGLFSAVVPSFFVRVLHESEPVATGAVVFVLFIATALGQLSIANVSPPRALRFACAALVAGTAVLAFAVASKSAALCFVAAAVEGVGQGLAMGSGLGAINEQTQARRGELSSTYFVMLYAALALPVIGTGALATAVGLSVAALIFCGAIGATVTLVWAAAYFASRTPLSQEPSSMK